MHEHHHQQAPSPVVDPHQEHPEGRQGPDVEEECGQKESGGEDSGLLVQAPKPSEASHNVTSHDAMTIPTVEAFREFKAIWDPDGKMNPDKVVYPYPITSSLRLGTDYSPPQPRTQFAFPEDRGSFAHATLRCVGVGKCRRLGGGTMCPSYMVTREEKHSTRGRAPLLFEML